jgi:hypothetical protein
VTGLVTGQCHLLKGLLFRLGLANYPTCERCHNKDGGPPHVLCNCEVQVELRFYHLRLGFIESSGIKASDYHEVPLSKVLHFIQSVGLLCVELYKEEARYIWDSRDASTISLYYKY